MPLETFPMWDLFLQKCDLQLLILVKDMSTALLIMYLKVLVFSNMCKAVL